MALLRILHITVLVFALLITSVNGHCTTPRVRREWRSISAIERARWINAVKCLAKLPQSPKVAATVDPAISGIPPKTYNSSYFDDFSYAHMDLNPFVHGTGLFLPWHRLYIQKFEDALRSKCGYDGVHPYWDWTKDTGDFYHATIFSNSTFDGLGTWGDPNNDFQISTGGFKDMLVAYPVPHYIRRNFTNAFVGTFPGVPPSETGNFVVNSFTGDYVNLCATLGTLSGPRGPPGPHLILGGEMEGTCPSGSAPPACNPPPWSPNDPMINLHHAMIDKIWYDWQHRDRRNKNSFGGGSISRQVNSSLSPSQYPTGGPPWLNETSMIPGDGLWKNFRVKDVLDTVGGKLCYVYE